MKAEQPGAMVTVARMDSCRIAADSIALRMIRERGWAIARTKPQQRENECSGRERAPAAKLVSRAIVCARFVPTSNTWSEPLRSTPRLARRAEWPDALDQGWRMRSRMMTTVRHETEN